MSDNAYRAVMAALVGITNCKGLDEIVRTQPFSLQVRIREALQNALALEGPFTHDHFEVVDEAFGKFGMKRPSYSIRECARELLKLADLREPRDPRDSQHHRLSGRYIRVRDGQAFTYDAVYTHENPRTYAAEIRLADDAPQSAPRDRLRGPLLDAPALTAPSDEMLRDLVRFAVESKIERSDATR